MPLTVQAMPRCDRSARTSGSRRRRAERTAPFSRSSMTASLLPRQDDPDVGALVERTAVVVAQHGVNREARRLEPPPHLRDRDGAERQRELLHRGPRAAPLFVLLVEDRQ